MCKEENTMLKSSRGIITAVALALVASVLVLAGCQSKPATSPASITISPSEAYNPIRTQHTLVAQVKNDDGSLVSGTAVEWILNRAPDAVGDIVSLDGSGANKVDNTYGVVKTGSEGEAGLTITSAYEGDTYITAYVPGISDAAVHKQYAVKHWLDLTARFPNNAINAVGTSHLFVVQTVKVSDGSAVGNVPVRFTIVGNDPKAVFEETVPPSTTYATSTDAYGFASATLKQSTATQGTNTVRIDVLAPPNRDFVLVTKDVTKQWQATKLGITKVGPAQIILLGQATYDIKVDNTGDLTATGVVLTDEIPVGMTYVSSSPAGTVSGKTITWNIGSLNKAESRTFKVVLEGTEVGLWTNTVVVASEEVGTATAQATTRVLPTPEVTIRKTGPSGIFTGFTRSYTLAVTNTGAVALTDVVITDTLPALLSYASSVPSGSVAGNQISWNLGTLNIGETKQVVVILGGEKSGTAINSATVTSKEGATATDTLPITVLGAPGAHMSLIDSSDPVSVNEELTYTMKVLNQSEGNSLHNMTVVGLIPPEMVYVSATGATAFTVVGQEVRFAPVAELKPGATVEFHIKVRTIAAGPAVFNATMRWDEFGEPIVDQEGTTVFQPAS
jgi:uncharacterized repeat protein (TIGR01451 family)